MTTATPDTAAAALRQREDEALAQIEAIKAAILRHRDSDTAAHWGEVGSLGLVNSKLTEALRAINY